MTPNPINWLRKHLFNTGLNSLLTIACLALIYQIGSSLIAWIFTQAQWTIIGTNLRLFLVGRYPLDQTWRIGTVLAIILGLSSLGLASTQVTGAQTKTRLTYLTWGLIPLALGLMLGLIGGGFGGLTTVNVNLWGGLLLTLLVAFTSTVLAFPLSVLLALGRQSKLPVIHWCATLYIEIVRGLPLIGILFMAQVMLPLVLPGELRLDRLIRAIAGLVLFNAAYLAENIRGGLQAIPRGQSEAAQALGFNTPLTLGLIILPQALRTVTPAIVGQFIALFKDTSLLSLFALLELTGMARSILAQPEFIGRYGEVYLFIGCLYWLFCYTMSILSRRLETKRD
jgi:general L-amino acid transport system permease protein